MEYRQTTIDGVTMIDYSRPVLRYHREALLEVFGWPYDEDMAQFPFYDLDNDDLQYLIDDY
jgi:hypothetical protein